jgi:hypothetical protein
MAEADGADAPARNRRQGCAAIDFTGKNACAADKKRQYRKTVEMDIEGLLAVYGLSPERMCDLKG